MSTDDYKNLYWSVIHKRDEKEEEYLLYNSEIKRKLLNISSENIELNKRIDLLEQNYIDGNIIGLSEKFFLTAKITRIMGALTGAAIFFIITNFGVWTLGSYGYSIKGLI